MSDVGRQFQELDEDARVSFVSENLNRLVKSSKTMRGIRRIVKWLKPLWAPSVNPPSDNDKKTVSMFTTILLYSFKEEFRYKWAEIIYNIYRVKTQQQVPELSNISERRKEVEALKWLHAGISPDLHKRFVGVVMEKNLGTWDDVFQYLLDASNYYDVTAQEVDVDESAAGSREAIEDHREAGEGVSVRENAEEKEETA